MLLKTPFLITHNNILCEKNNCIFKAMDRFFDFVARGVGSLTLLGGGNYSMEDARELIGFSKERRSISRYFTEEELEMLKSPTGSIAFGFEQVGKAMIGAVADVKQKHGI